MESAHKSGGGSAPGAGAGGEGVLCHACGYQYPNGHPSAKQRRAHRKHCGKPTSAAAAAGAEEGAGEHDGSDLLLGEGGGGAGADGHGAGAAECGGGSTPGSAYGEPGDDAVEGGGDSAGADPSGNGAGHQVIGDKSSEDCLVSSSNIPYEITSGPSRTDDGTMTTVATQYSEKGSPIEDGDPSDPAVGSEQLQDVPTSVVPQDPEDRAKFSSEISENEIQNSSTKQNSVDPAGGETSELTSDVVRQQDGVAVTGEDGLTNTIGESKSNEGKSVQGDELGLTCQDILQTERAEEHSNTVVEEYSGDKNPTASNNEEILSDETESNQQSKHELTDSFEKVPKIEPVESSAEKSVGTDDDMPQLGNGGCHSEIPDDIKAQQQPDSTSGMADHLANSKGSDNVEGQHYPTTDESIEAISSTPAAGAEVVSVNASANLTEDVCSSGITMDDNMQENVASGTVLPSQIDLVDLGPSATAHEINMVDSTNDVDEKRQNEKSSTDLASYEVKEMVTMDNFEEKQQNKEVIVDPTAHEGDSFPSTDNHGENEQNEEIVADTTSYKISAVQSMSSTEEKEQIEEFIANLASEEINVASKGDMVEQQDETDVKTNQEMAHSVEATGENNATAGESNGGTITDDVEDRMHNEEITSGTISLNITGNSINEEQMNNEVANGSHDNIVVHDPNNVKEKMSEEITSGPIIDKFSLLTSTESPEERKDETTSADPLSHETNVAQTNDGVDEEKVVEPAADPTSSAGTGNIGDPEDKKLGEETTTDPRPIENTTAQGTEDAEISKENESTTSICDAEDKKQSEETTIDPTPVEKATTQGTEDAESSKQNENTNSIGDAEDKKQSEETTADPSVKNATAQGTEDAEKQNENATTTNKTAEVSQNTNVIEVKRDTVEDTASKEISTIDTADDLKGATDQNEEIADKEMVTDSDRNHVSLKVLLADKNVETKEKEKKASTKDRVLSFRRRVSKDNVPPVKPGSPKDGSGQQDWNSPARLPVEKKAKGRKQQWVPFICCSSVQ